MKYLKFVLAGLVLAMAAPASAYDWNVATKVTMVEPTYMPGGIVFALDVAAGTCAAGSFLTYVSQGATDAEKQANAKCSIGGSSNRPGAQCRGKCIWK